MRKMKHADEIIGVENQLRKAKEAYAKKAISIVRQHFDVDNNMQERYVALLLVNSVDLVVAMTLCMTAPQEGKKK